MMKFCSNVTNSVSRQKYFWLAPEVLLKPRIWTVCIECGPNGLIFVPHFLSFFYPASFQHMEWKPTDVTILFVYCWISACFGPTDPSSGEFVQLFTQPLFLIVFVPLWTTYRSRVQSGTNTVRTNGCVNSCTNSLEDGPVGPKHVEIQQYTNKIVTSVAFSSIHKYSNLWNLFIKDLANFMANGDLTPKHHYVSLYSSSCVLLCMCIYYVQWQRRQQKRKANKIWIGYYPNSYAQFRVCL